MRFARRYWVVAAIAGVLALVGTVATSPIPLVAGLVLGLWLLTHQLRFLRSVATVERAEFSLTATRARVAVNTPVVVRMRVVTEEPLPFDLTVVPALPPSAGRSSHPVSMTLSAGDRTATTTFRTAGHAVGTMTIGPARATLHDDGSLLESTIGGTDTVRIDIRPRAPRGLHVGEGGDPLTEPYGEHKSDTGGTGIEPYEIREYEPGDQLSRIDWKATARLNHPHIRDFERTISHETVLVVDHRATMGVGPESRTKLDYLRTVGLSFVDSAAGFDDPLGLYTVDDGGVTTAREPAAGLEGYDPIRGRLKALTPADESGGTRGAPIGPTRARSLANRLADDGTRLGETLRPYVATTERYVRRIRDRPLFRAAQLAHSTLSDRSWTVILTDDSHPTELRETVKFARRNGKQVLVFLAPSVLYEPDGLVDLDQAHDRYRTFEEFRKSLARLARVSAFEVAPDDRLDAVLGRRSETGRRRRNRDTARASRRYQQYGEEPRQGLVYDDESLRSLQEEGTHDGN